MALKVAIAAGGAVKAMLKPALLGRPWEVSGEWAVGQLQGLQRDLHPIETRSRVTALGANPEFDWLCEP